MILVLIAYSNSEGQGALLPEPSLLTYLNKGECLRLFYSLRPINNLSVKQGRVFLGCSSTMLE